MSNQLVGTVYSKIMDDVLSDVANTFEEEGVNHSVLDELKKTWQRRLTSSKCASFPWDPPPVPQPMVNPTPVPSNVPRPQPMPTTGSPALSATSNGSNNVRIKEEPSYANHALLNGLPPAYGNPVAAKRAAQIVEQRFGVTTNPQVNMLPTPATMSNPGQQQQSPQNIQLPPHGAEQQRREYAERRMLQMRQMQQQSQQMPQPEQRSQVSNAQTDGVAEWDDMVTKRRALALADPTGVLAADVTIRQRLEESSRAMEGGGLLLPLSEQPNRLPVNQQKAMGTPASHVAPPTRPSQFDGSGDSDQDTKAIKNEDLGDDDDDEDAINSDLDDPDDDVVEEVGEDNNQGQIMLCTYDKVQRVKNKWKCVLKDGVLTTGGKDPAYDLCITLYDSAHQWVGPDGDFCQKATILFKLRHSLAATGPWPDCVLLRTSDLLGLNMVGQDPTPASGSAADDIPFLTTSFAYHQSTNVRDSHRQGWRCRGSPLSLHVVLAAALMNVLPSIFTGAHHLNNGRPGTSSTPHHIVARQLPSGQSSPRHLENLPNPSSTSNRLPEKQRSPRYPPTAAGPPRTPPFLAKSKKRALSRLPINPPLLGGQPPSKRPRHRLRAHRTIDRFAARRSLDEAPLSPTVFLDDTSSTRPALPLRLSSSSASTKMLGKGVKDDSGAVRTLKLARGSLKLSNLSQTRSSGMRSSASGSAMDIDEVQNSPGLQLLGQIGVTELLEQDERPTFIIDLADQANYEPGPINVVFANFAFEASDGLYEMVCGKGDQDSPGLAAATAFSDFKAWLTSYVRHHESLDIGLPSFFFLGITWTCCALRRRLRVIKGVPGSATGSIASNPPSVGLPTAFIPRRDGHRHTSSIYETSVGSASEPLDYFGNFKASLPAVASPVHKKSESISHGSLSEGSKTKSKKRPDSLSRRSNDSFSSQKGGSTPKAASTPRAAGRQLSSALPPSPLGLHHHEAILGAAVAGEVDQFSTFDSEGGFFDWTRLPSSPALPPHIRFARSVDWATTKLGPIESWSSELRSMCNLIMASPHPAAMWWGEDMVAIYNEAYILLAGQKHPSLMGQTYQEAWGEIWDRVKDVFANAFSTGQATMKDDDCLFIQRSGTPGYLEETYFSWSIIPIVGADGSVVGLYNPAFEKTRRKVAERRMLTLREVGEKTAAARDLKNFYQQVLGALAYNEYDTPFVMIYSVEEDLESEASSADSGAGIKLCTLEGTLPGVPEGHRAAPAHIDLYSGTHFWGPVFRKAMMMSKPLYLQTSNGTLDSDLLQGIHWRGFGDAVSAAVCFPIHLTSEESILGFLLMGVNPRRPYDDDYSLFIQLLGRQLTTSVASVVLFEEEIARGKRAAQLAAMDRNELSEQLAIRTQEAVESETKFSRMAEFAPVGIFIADSKGKLTYCNDTWYEISRITRGAEASIDWMDYICEQDRVMVDALWLKLVQNIAPVTAEFRFQAQWEVQKGQWTDTWVLASAYPEKDGEGRLKVIFGSITNISQQKWAEHLEKRKMEEALEMKRQQENFIDITSHEMRNPLSAILQCADEISSTLTGYRESDESTQSLDDLLDSNIDAAQTIALCAQHQKRIVDDILTLSKLDSALLLVTPCDVMPVSVVQRALKMFDGEVQTARIKLDFRIDDSLRRLNVQWVKLDPSRLLQVLINLTTNAIKFTTTQAKRIITVTLAASIQRPSQTSIFDHVSYIPSRTKRKDSTDSEDWGSGEKIYLFFAVQDTGRGLSEDETKLLFHRFSQASPRTHVQYGGSGLGLFISRELVELQGGQIGVLSKSGEGSTFAFYITSRRTTSPTSSEILNQPPSTALRQETTPKSSRTNSADVPTAMRPSDPSASKAGLRVLIVEDNLVNQRVLSRQLRNIGCTVTVANHGGECLARLRESNFWAGNQDVPDALDLGVILMDQEMPVMDGLTCTREIRRLQAEGEVVRHVPIIAVTANARSEQIDTAIAVGMVS
ncbi:MAG: hypothetical protein Q9218_004001 [Villophora microphyllina]